MKVKAFSFLATFLMMTTLVAQNYKGAISTLEKNGVHKIMLPKNVRAACQNNLNFLRLINDRGQQVPYVALQPEHTSLFEFVPFEKISKSKIKDSITSIVIENTKGIQLDNLTLRITNTNITKTYTVFGSPSGDNWYGLVADQRLSNLKTIRNTILEQTIHLPLNDYKYLRVDFNDKTSLPVNIMNVGSYKSKFFKQVPIELVDYTIKTELLSDKKITRLTFTAAHPHKIDAIFFKINTPFFLRDAVLRTPKTRKVKRREEPYNYNIREFQLNSKNSNIINFENLNEKTFFIDIANKDNLPLDIESIQLYQKPLYLIAHLNSHETYQIIVDRSLKAPIYDLGNFISTKSTNISQAVITTFYKVSDENNALVTPLKFWQTKTFMWTCLILVGFFIIYYATRLLKDIDSKNS